MSYFLRVSTGAGAVALMLLALGCTKKTVKRGPTTVTTSGVESVPTLFPEGGEGGDVEPSFRNSVLQKTPSLSTVHFAFDSPRLDSEARAILAENAKWLKSRSKLKVQVAGHCDQRGTVEYNLALGQRRAKGVRAYYRTLGIPGSMIGTISYGEEKPLCVEETESCWLKNRRGETLVAFPSDVTQEPSDKPLTP